MITSPVVYAYVIHYFSGRALGSCIIYHQLTCRNSMIICTHSKSQAIFTRPDYNINLFPLPSIPTVGRGYEENPWWRFSHLAFSDDEKFPSLKEWVIWMSIPKRKNLSNPMISCAYLWNSGLQEVVRVQQIYWMRQLTSIVWII